MRNNILNIVLLLVTVSLISTGCSKDDETMDNYESVKQQRLEKMTKSEKVKFLESQEKPLAIVNGKKIFESDLQDGDLNKTVINEVLYQVAVDRGIDKDVKPDVENYERNLILSIIKEQIKKEIQPNVTDEEINAYFKDHKSEYAHVEMEELATAKEDLAHDARREVLKGTDFGSIPSLFNTENTQNVVFRNNSSIVGVFFSDAIKIGQVSQVIDSNDHYIIQKVVSKREPTYDELMDIISVNLLKQKTQNSYDQKIEDLKKEKKVEMLAELPAEEEKVND